MKQKPIQLTREEFAKSLAELVDNTLLPAFVKIDVLNSVNQTLSVIATQEYEQAKVYWKKEKGAENDSDKSNESDKV